MSRATACNLSLLFTGAAPFVRGQSVVMDEVVVTANKREQSIQDVATAVTASSDTQLRELGIKDRGVHARGISVRRLGRSVGAVVANY